MAAIPSAWLQKATPAAIVSSLQSIMIAQRRL
jgi:hypothetical protein